MAQTGAEITLAVRNTDAGAQAAADITTTTGNRNIHVARLDFADRASIAAFVSSSLEGGSLSSFPHISAPGLAHLARLCLSFALSARNGFFSTAVIRLEYFCLSAKLWRFWRPLIPVGDNFARFTKSYLAETTPLLKLSQQAIRKELRRDFDAFSFYPVSQRSRKTAHYCLEKLCGRTIERQTAINQLPGGFKANHEKLYVSRKRRELIQTTKVSPTGIVIVNYKRAGAVTTNSVSGSRHP